MLTRSLLQSTLWLEVIYKVVKLNQLRLRSSFSCLVERHGSIGLLLQSLPELGFIVCPMLSITLFQSWVHESGCFLF